MGSHKTKGSSYTEPLPPKQPDFNVTGLNGVSPNCTCNYYHVGTFADEPCYKRGDGLWWIWRYSIINGWALSASPGDTTGPYWSVPNTSHVYGIYDPQNGASGVINISAGGH